jgi:ketose-bisphosphate aldolase
MPIVPMQAMLAHALRHRYAVGYFEAWDLYSMEAALAAAEESRSPCILGFGAAVTETAWVGAHGVEALSALAVALAARATVPTCVLFNEAQRFDHAVRGLRAGCNAVMLDSSALPDAEHTVVTARLVEVAHALGAAVEAELGHLPNADDPSHTTRLTDPAEAARFCAATGIDALAVSIGNVHILQTREAQVDIDLLDRIYHATGLPQVIHGGTGFPRAAVADAIRAGAAKFNVGTALKQAFLDGMRGALDAPAGIHAQMGGRGDADVLEQGKRRMQERILELIALYGSAGHADDSLNARHTEQRL